MKCEICDSEVELEKTFYGSCIELRCPVCRTEYVGNLDVTIEVEGLNVKGSFKGTASINLRPKAIPVYRQAWKEKWDTKRLLKELQKVSEK